MATFTKILKLTFIFFIIFAILTSQAQSQSEQKCESEEDDCHDKTKATPLKIIAIASILVASLIGICFPLLTRSIPSLNPERNIFLIIKGFAAGIILSTGFVHVLPDSFEMLSKDCLKKPWVDFPFAGFVSMLAAVFALMVDSIASSIYIKRYSTSVDEANSKNEHGDGEIGMVNIGHGHGHGHHIESQAVNDGLLRYRVIALVLELGIVVHSVVIGLALGASDNVCSIKSLMVALCFHQMFEGMGLGSCIVQANYKVLKKMVMIFFFVVTTPFGIALGIALKRAYDEDTPVASKTVGLLNAGSSGILIYMALVDLLSADFMGPKLQASLPLQIKTYISVLLGIGAMSLMAKWA